MKRLKQTTLHGLAVILLLFVSLCSYGQSRQEKTDLIIAKLKLVEGQKMMHQYRLDPLKQHVSGNDSVRIVELEKQLSEEQVAKVVNRIFEEHLNDEEIDNIYSFLQSSAYKKLFDPADIFKAIQSHYSYFDDEIDRITNGFDEPLNPPSPMFEPIPIEREDGFYVIVDYNKAADDKDVQLEENPSMTSKDIQEVKIHSYDGMHSEIIIQFTKEGTMKFYTVTKENIGKPLAIVLGKRIVAMPTINDSIMGGRVSITGIFSDEEMDEMMERLQEK
jgi:hypothetical protein